MIMNNVDNNLLGQEEETSIDFRRYLGLLRQWWWLFILATVLAGGAGYYYSSRLTPIYQASATMMINEAPSTNRTVDLTSITTSERLAQTYVNMMTRQPVMQKVIERLGIQMTPVQLAGMTTVKQINNTQLLSITVQSPDPGFSAAVANAVVIVFSEQLEDQQSSRYAASKKSLEDRIAEIEKQVGDLEDQVTNQKRIVEQKRLGLAEGEQLSVADPDVAELDRIESRLNQYEALRTNLVTSYEQVRLAEAQNNSSASLMERADVPVRPIKPNIPQNTMLAALVGLMISAGGVFVIDLFDDTLRNPEDITRRFKLTVLGTIANYQEPEDGQLITLAQPRSPVTESFRGLRTNVQYASVDTPLRTLLVTSPAPADGKTTVAANLAMVMAQSGRKVTVVDADLHRPRVHSIFKVESRPGLSSLFIKPTVHLNGSLQSTPSDRLKVISAGELPPNPSELLGSNKMREIIDVVLETSDFVILDTPPVLSVTDAVVLAPVVDGVMIVVRPGNTRFTALKYAIEQLRYVGANIIGVVINRVDDHSSRYGYYYKSYYYKQYKYYSTNGKAPKRRTKKDRPAEITEPVESRMEE